jgi:hypothetical protein
VCRTDGDGGDVGSAEERNKGSRHSGHVSLAQCAFLGDTELVVKIVGHLDPCSDQRWVHDLELSIVGKRMPSDIAQLHCFFECSNLVGVRTMKAHTLRAVEVHRYDPRLEHEVKLVISVTRNSAAELLAYPDGGGEVVIKVPVDNPLAGVRKANVQMTRVDNMNNLDVGRAGGWYSGQGHGATDEQQLGNHRILW